MVVDGETVIGNVIPLRSTARQFRCASSSVDTTMMSLHVRAARWRMEHRGRAIARRQPAFLQHDGAPVLKPTIQATRFGVPLSIAAISR